jgi:hypothetical protein
MHCKHHYMVKVIGQLHILAISALGQDPLSTTTGQEHGPQSQLELGGQREESCLCQESHLGSRTLSKLLHLLTPNSYYGFMLSVIFP